MPPKAPVKLYWSATAYDRDTHALIRDQKWSSRASTTQGLQKNDDGSVDVLRAEGAGRQEIQLGADTRVPRCSSATNA